MTKSKKAVMVTVRMTELQLSRLEYVQEPGETRSAAMRRLVNEKWFDQNMAFDAEQDSSEWDHCEARG